MKRLIAPLVLLAAAGIALAMTAGRAGSIGARASDPPVPAVSVGAPGRQRRLRPRPGRAGDTPTLLVLGAVV